MGTTLQFVVIKALEEGPLPTSLTLVDSRAGWVSTSTSNHSLQELEIVCTDSLVTPAIAGSVEDSDYAYLFATDDHRIVSRFVINPDRAKDYKEGVWALDACKGSNVGKGWPDLAARGMAQWSDMAPHHIDHEAVKAILDRDWLYAEDSIVELVAKLDLPAPFGAGPRFEGALSLMECSVVIAPGKSVDMKNSRYVVGWGNGFLGIWDRNSAGPPIRRFPATGEGLAKANEELLSLLDED